MGHNDTMILSIATDQLSPPWSTVDSTKEGVAHGEIGGGYRVCRERSIGRLFGFGAPGMSDQG